MRTVNMKVKGVFDYRSGSAGYGAIIDIGAGSDTIWFGIRGVIRDPICTQQEVEVEAIGRSIVRAYQIGAVKPADRIRLSTDCREIIGVLRGRFDLAVEGEDIPAAKRVKPSLRDCAAMDQLAALAPSIAALTLVYEPADPRTLAAARAAVAEGRADASVS